MNKRVAADDLEPTVRLAFVKMIRGQVDLEMPVETAIDWLEQAWERHQDWDRVRSEFRAAIERLKTTKG